jgi:hypothetical protein
MSRVTGGLLRVTPRANDDRPAPLVRDLNGASRATFVRVERALYLLAGFGALRRGQLEALLVGDTPLSPGSRRVVTYRVIVELRELELAQEIGFPGQPARASLGYTLTERGHRAYAARDPAYPTRRIRNAPSVMLLDHASALAETALLFGSAALAAGDVTLGWESDWEAVARIGPLPAVPDALVTLERSGWRARAFIEADRATEWYSAFALKVRRYVELYRGDAWRASLRVWPLILTVTTSDARARSLTRVAERVTRDEGASRITRAFRFVSLDELRERGPLARIWQVGAERMGILDERPSDAHGDATC